MSVCIKAVPGEDEKKHEVHQSVKTPDKDKSPKLLAQKYTITININIK
jgi:hypothetical protein